MIWTQMTKDLHNNAVMSLSHEPHLSFKTPSSTTSHHRNRLLSPLHCSIHIDSIAYIWLQNLRLPQS